MKDKEASALLYKVFLDVYVTQLLHLFLDSPLTRLPSGRPDALFSSIHFNSSANVLCVHITQRNTISAYYYLLLLFRQ